MSDIPPQLMLLARRFLSAIGDISQALQRQGDAIAESTKSANEKHNVPPEVVADLRAPQGIEIHKGKDDTTSERKYQRRTLLLAWLTLGAVVFYGLVAYLQWKEMIRATGAAQDAVHEARLNRQGAQKSLDATIGQFRLDQRAWVVPEFINTTIEPGGYVSQTAKIENRGRTPAMHLHYEFMITPIGNNEIPHFSYPGWDYSANAPIMFPNTPFAFTFGVTRDSGDHKHAEPVPIDKTKTDRGEMLLLVYGAITYDDVFGGHHFVHMCAPQRMGNILFVSNPASKTCVAYNQIDSENNREPK